MNTIENDLVHVLNLLKQYQNELLPDDELSHFVQGNSKRIRAKLALMYLRAYDKEPNETIYKILTIGELIHNASLLHDDVIDSADYRRNATTISKKFSSKISILCGDYLLSIVADILLNINNQEISSLFKICVENMVKAEIKQFSNRNIKLSEVEYIDICIGKTAGLFSVILQTVAKLLDLDEEKSSKFGEIFGILFQIKNDNDKESILQDKQNGIFTLKDILGIEKLKLLSDNYKQELLYILKSVPNNVYKKGIEELIREL